MASNNKPPEIPPRRHSSTVFPNKTVNENSVGASQPSSPSFLPRRHSFFMDDNIDNENDTICLVFSTTCLLMASANLKLSSYKFGYGVNDQQSGDIKEQQESKDLDQVTGYYKTLDSDGLMRTVNYQAHPLTGFHAQVRREPVGGQSKIIAGKTILGMNQSPIVRNAEIEPEPILSTGPIVGAPILEPSYATAPLLASRYGAASLLETGYDTASLLAPKYGAAPILEPKYAAAAAPFLAPRYGAAPILEPKYAAAAPFLAPRYGAAPILEPKYAAAAPFLAPRYGAAAILEPSYAAASLLAPRYGAAPILEPSYAAAQLLASRHGAASLLETGYAAAPLLEPKLATTPLLSTKWANDQTMSSQSMERSDHLSSNTWKERMETIRAPLAAKIFETEAPIMKSTFDAAQVNLAPKNLLLKTRLEAAPISYAPEAQINYAPEAPIMNMKLPSAPATIYSPEAPILRTRFETAPIVHLPETYASATPLRIPYAANAPILELKTQSFTNHNGPIASPARFLSEPLPYQTPATSYQWFKGQYSANRQAIDIPKYYSAGTIGTAPIAAESTDTAIDPCEK